MPADYQLFIDGQLMDAAAGETFETIDPSTGQPHATVARARAADAERAVAAARAAFADGRWSGLKPEQRAAVLDAVAGKLREHGDRLVELEVRDSGGTIRKTRAADVNGAAFTFRTYAEFGGRIPTERPLPFTVAPGPSHNYVRREPVGVCAGIVPWNFPIQNAAWKVAPALAAGNTIVLKPAEQTPCTAVELAKLCAEAGVPDGVVNVLPGFGPEAGEPLVTSPQVDKVAFTGSTEVGRHVQALAAGTVKKVLLELGGKSANIVLEDADLDLAVDGAIYAIFFHQGQVCYRGEPPAGGPPDLRRGGRPPGRDRRAYQRRPGGRQGLGHGPAGLRRTTGTGRALRPHRPGGGRQAGHRRPPRHCRRVRGRLLLRPHHLHRRRPGARIAQEEIFGPVLAVIPYDGDEQAVAIANDSDYGLPARYGAATRPGRSRWPKGCAPAPSGSTTTTCSTPSTRSAATSSRGRPRAWRGGLPGVHPDQARARRHLPAARQHRWFDVTVPRRRPDAPPAPPGGATQGA